jgi:exosortase/archaeosortase family protein
VFYLALTRRAFFRYLYMIPAAFFWVIVANVLRILLVCLLSMEFDLPVVEGPGHTLLGVFVFVFALGMIFSTDRLLLFVLPLRLTEGLPQPSSNFQSATVRFPRLRLGALFASVLLMISFGFLGGLSVVRGELFTRELDLALGEEDFFSLPRQALPQEWNDWILADYREESRDFDNPMGAYSQSWTYVKQNKVCLFSISSPFPAWHDLAVCYQNIGWNLVKQEDIVYPETSPYQGERTELTLQRDGEGFQYVLFSAIDVERQPVPVPKLYRVDVTRRFMDEIKMLSQSLGLNKRSATPPIYQVQLLVKTRLPLSAPQLQQCRELFGHMRALTRENARRGPVHLESEE